MQYEDIIKRLRSIEPMHSNPSLLTDHILNKIQDKESNQRFFLLRANQKQWLVFNGFRILFTSAAVFLIAFFLFQQWEFNRKLQKLEELVSLTGVNYHDSKYVVAEWNNVLFLDGDLNHKVDSADMEMLLVNRKTLNFLRKKIEDLEDENLTIREKLQQYKNDSTFLIKKQLKP